MTRADQMKASIARLEQARGRDYAFGYLRSMAPAYVHYVEQALFHLDHGDPSTARIYLYLVAKAHEPIDADAARARKASS